MRKKKKRRKITRGLYLKTNLDKLRIYRKEYGKNRYKNNRNEILNKVKAYRAANKERIKLVRGIYYQKNKEKICTKKKETYKKYKEKRLAHAKEYGKVRRPEIKLKVMINYGNGKAACVCCGEDNIDFLTLDHINNDGNTFRKSNPRLTGFSLYRWLVNNNFPSGLQTLCFNCNCGKGIRGICPHQLIKQQCYSIAEAQPTQ